MYCNIVKPSAHLLAPVPERTVQLGILVPAVLVDEETTPWKNYGYVESHGKPPALSC